MKKKNYAKRFYFINAPNLFKNRWAIIVPLKVPFPLLPYLWLRFIASLLLANTKIKVLPADFPKSPQIRAFSLLLWTYRLIIELTSLLIWILEAWQLEDTSIWDFSEQIQLKLRKHAMEGVEKWAEHISVSTGNYALRCMQL